MEEHHNQQGALTSGKVKCMLETEERSLLYSEKDWTHSESDHTRWPHCLRQAGGSYIRVGFEQVFIYGDQWLCGQIENRIMLERCHGFSWGYGMCFELGCWARNSMGQRRRRKEVRIRQGYKQDEKGVSVWWMPSLRVSATSKSGGIVPTKLLSLLILTANLGVFQSHFYFDNLLEEWKNSLKAIILTVIVYYRERTHPRGVHMQRLGWS